MADVRQALEAEVAGFRAWAEALPAADRSGEWEALYTGWKNIYRAFKAFVRSTTCREWDEELIQLLLYIIARDNEMQELAQELAKHADALVCLAEHALVSSERDAKWQLVVELGHLQDSNSHADAEALLLQFAHDTDEYVRRRSLIALADIGSSKVEELVASAWETGDEYQRMAVLHALWKVHSTQLETYLTEADADGREYLVAYATRIRTGNPD